MKYPLVILLALGCCSCVLAQGLEDLLPLEHGRIHHQRNAMVALGGWAVANIGVGLALRSREGAAGRFHEMNAIWNVVNLGIAGIGYLTLGDPQTTAAGGWQENVGFEKILLFNAGLDVGYVLGGIYLTERSRRPGADADRLLGYGRSIVLQGGFLLVFDLANYFIAHGRDAGYRILLGGTSEGLGLTYTF